jgi:hypothetical protein
MQRALAPRITPTRKPPTHPTPWAAAQGPCDLPRPGGARLQRPAPASGPLSRPPFARPPGAVSLVPIPLPGAPRRHSCRLAPPCRGPPPRGRAAALCTTNPTPEPGRSLRPGARAGACFGLKAAAPQGRGGGAGGGRACALRCRPPAPPPCVCAARTPSPYRLLSTPPDGSRCPCTRRVLYSTCPPAFPRPRPPCDPRARCPGNIALFHATNRTPYAKRASETKPVRREEEQPWPPRPPTSLRRNPTKRPLQRGQPAAPQARGPGTQERLHARNIPSSRRDPSALLLYYQTTTLPAAAGGFAG